MPTKNQQSPNFKAVSCTVEQKDEHAQRQYKRCNSRQKDLGF